MNPVVHFEMPYEDGKRMSDFYTKAFGWKTKTFGEEMGNYITATTGETDANGRPKNPGYINGGFYKKSADHNTVSFVITVDDITAHVAKVKEAGGQIIGEPNDIPGVGLYVSFKDTEGNICSLLQPKPMMEVHPEQA